MTKMQALYSFFSGFGIPAVEENSIYSPDATPALPYITYSVNTADFLYGDIPITASIWYRTTSWQAPEAKMQEISKALSGGGVQIPCEDGFLWLKKGSGKFAQMTDDPSDNLIKRIILSIVVEYFTTY